MKKAVLVLLFAMIAPRSFAADCSLTNFLLDRDAAHVGGRVEAVVTGTCTFSDVPFDAIVRRNGQFIVIDLQRPQAGLNQPALWTWGERVALPALFPGTYSVVVRSRGEEIGRETLVVREVPSHITPRIGVVADEVAIRAPRIMDCPLSWVGCRDGVYFGEVSAEYRYAEDGRIIARVPAGVSGRVPVTVRQFDGAVVLLDEFLVGPGSEGDFERVLFPMNFYGAGAHGSQWRTEIAVRNDGPVAVRTIPEFWVQPDSPVLPIAYDSIPAGARGQFVLRPRDGGEFLYVPRGLEKQLSYSSHLVDRSRSATDLGSEIPVVHAEETARTIRLLDVPTAANFRAKLRVYDFDPVNGRSVTVTVQAANGNVLATRKLTLTGAPVCANSPCFAERPPFAALDIDLLENVRGVESAHVTIESDTNEGRIWAFVSVTNNETQNVTLYTPQHGHRRVGE